MPKFFISSKNFVGDRVIITGSDVHHIGTVLRKKPGNEIIITSEDKTDFRAQIETITPFEIRLRILEHLPASFHNQHRIILAQGIPRHAKMDLIIQKATELGVEEIIPLISRYSFVNSEGTISQTRWARWQKICLESAKQCGRNHIPELHPPTQLSVLSRLEKGSHFLRLFLWEKERRNHLKGIISHHKNQHKTINKIIILIGPEGGFADDEIQLAIQARFIPVSCAPWILRCETAALYALAIIQYEYNFP